MKTMTKRRTRYAAGMITELTVAISLTGCAGASPYPDVITVQNAERAISKMTVTGNEEVTVDYEIH